MEKKQIEKIINESKTIFEALTKMNKNKSSAGYKYFKKYVKENHIDISHFLTQKEIIERTFKDGKIKKIETEEMLVENSMTSRGAVKSRIIKEKLLDYQCSLCKNDGKWFGKKITLILDHINGISNDNRIQNLRFLCPNCNSTLVTHCMGAKGYELSMKKKQKKNLKKKYKPRPNTRKVERPDMDILKQQIEELGYVKTGKLYGVSDNAIRKWIKWANNRT